MLAAGEALRLELAAETGESAPIASAAIAAPESRAGFSAAGAVSIARSFHSRGRSAGAARAALGGAHQRRHGHDDADADADGSGRDGRLDLTGQAHDRGAAP